jgi:ribosome-binding protein aMBF1 (putative translation factor)
MCMADAEAIGRGRQRAGEAVYRLGRALDPRSREDLERYFVAVGRRIAERRTAIGLSQRELAARCGTTQSAIARLEGGGTPPRLSTLVRIARALDCDLVVALRPREEPDTPIE